MTKIIVTGVDGSETADEAATKAAELAVAFGANLHILTVYGKLERTTFASGSQHFPVTTGADADNTAAPTVNRLRKEFPALTITSSVSEGKPGEELVKAADQLAAELIVVGNKRVQGIARVLGSVARDVAAGASCDIFIAHTHQR